MDDFDDLVSSFKNVYSGAQYCLILRPSLVCLAVLAKGKVLAFVSKHPFPTKGVLGALLLLLYVTTY
jgi:hypothetical protein